MQKLTPQDLLPLERYAAEREALRARLIEHKRPRRVALGRNATLHFEDRLTMLYQVQEVLRVERLVEPGEIQAELDGYNPLIPDGDNWKATLLLEYPDAAERKAMVRRLAGVEGRVWLRVAGFEPVWAAADGDGEVAGEGGRRTATVHFLRFDLTPEMIAAAKGGARLAAGIDHEALRVEYDPLPVAVSSALARDLV